MSAFTMGIAAFQDTLSKYVTRVTRQDLIQVLLSSTFVVKVRAYLTSRMDAHLAVGASLQEHDTLQYRGVVWAGWATREGRWGEESTRFYLRKRSRTQEQRAVVLKAFGSEAAQAYNDGGVLGHSVHRRAWNALPVAQRPVEMVWRLRAGGPEHYTATSKLMYNRGALKQSVENMITTIIGDTVEFRPGADAAYFKYQDARRPIFVLFEPEDGPVLQQLFAEAVEELMAA